MPRALQKTSQGVIVFRGDGIELVIVATSTGDGQTEEGLGEDVDLVVNPAQFLFTCIDRRMSSLTQKKETGAQKRLVESLCRLPPGRGQQVAGHLLDQERVVGKVEIESANHVVA